MFNFLIHLFIKDYQNISSSKVRRKYGNLASIFGIITNAIICLFKLIIGLMFGLISLIADGLNNLADASSSIITFIGFKLSSKPADKDHPFGHARIEYITGFIVSIVICILGLQLILNSFNDIIINWNQEFIKLANNEFYITISVLFVAILFKIYQCFFYHKISKLISSTALKATAKDSRNDVIATFAVLLGLILSNTFNFYIDGYLGCAVGLFILYSGFKLILETSKPLISEKVNPDLVNSIIKKVLSYEGVLGIHDLQIHSYGPSIYFASIHVEVDAFGSLLSTHNLIDNIEKDILKELNVTLTIHMDPVVLNDPFTEQIKAQVLTITNNFPYILNVHDFRIVKDSILTNIIFDINIAPEAKISDEMIKQTIEKEVSKLNQNYHTIITIDHDYISYIEKN